MVLTQKKAIGELVGWTGTEEGLTSTQLQMPELLAFDDDASSKWWQKINEAMEVVFCDYNNLVLGCECVCEGSKRAELGRRWRRQNSENLHW